MAKLIRRLAALAAPLAFILAVALPARADTYVVDDSADLVDDNVGDGICHTATGTCTLRAAVQEANAHAGPDAITLPAGTYVLTQTGFGEDNAVTGDLDITGDLTITGVSAATTFIDGDAADRIFDVKVPSGKAVALFDLTIRNGDARPDGANGISSGGGIFIDDQATLSLFNVVVISNHADSGGGINNYDGWLSVSGGAILSNTTNYEGGGIGSGGYYYAYSGGGGSAPSKESAKEKPGPIVSRRIPAPADAGRDSAARGPITATVPDRLPAPARPAPARILAFAYDTIILSATTVAGNFADGYGGGGVYASGPLTVTGSVIQSNTTGNLHGYGDGAGIELYDTFFISGTRIVSNTALFDSDDDSGGGLAAYGYDRGYILNSTFVHNSASYGGAVYISRYGAYITGTTFHDNFAWQYGGALYGGLSSYDGLLSLENTTLDHNTTRGDGGGYYADSGEHLFQNVTLVNNTADIERDNAGDGGGLKIGNYTTVRVRNTVLAANAVSPPETRAVFANCFTDGDAAVLESLGHNAFGIGASCPISGLLPSDLVGVDARLASRDADGALSPLPGSPLIDAGDGAACPAVDQRGVTRPQLGGCDIGAVEASTTTVAVLSGYVYGDRGADGIRSPGEPGIDNAEVRVAGGALDQVARAAPDGFWAFLLPAGIYTLTESQPAGYLDGIDALGSAGGTLGNDLFAGIVLTAAQRGEGYLFGESGPSRVAGRIFVDADEDGLWNAAIDYGLSGQTVTLSGTTRMGDPLELTALTDNAGLFVFPAIPAGTYVLSETQPTGYVDYTDTVGTGGGVLAGSAPDNDLIAGIIVTDNTDIGGYAFGELVALSIDATEFVDYDADGAPGNIDDRINGITITLSGFDFRGRAVLMTALTGDAGSGSVAFGGLAPGVYTLTAAQPAEYADGPDLAYLSSPGLIGNDMVSGIVLTTGVPYRSYFFTEYPAGIAGIVFDDADLDGRYAYESGIAGITVTLTGTTSLGAGVFMTTFTDYSGRFVFTGALTGTYALWAGQADGFVDGLEQAGSFGGVTGTIGSDLISGIVFTPTRPDGSPNGGAGYTFGEIRATSIHGDVFVDANENGNYDATFFYCDQYPQYYTCDPALPGVTVVLTGIAADTGESVWLTTTSVALPPEYGSFFRARYTFSSLRPGTYTLTEIQPEGYDDGPMLNAYPAAEIGPNRFGGIQVGPYYNVGPYTFGELPGGITGYVFQDGNNNGARDPGEAGIFGVSVSLAYRLNTGTTGISTTTTNNLGRYRFLGIAPGVYTITEQSQALSPLTSWLDGAEQPGSLPATLTDDVFAGIIISAGQTASGFNFGELNPNTLQAYVFHDRDRDHAYSYQPDAPMVGVTFVLTGSDDRGPVGPLTQTSDGGGYAYFQRLRPGTYALVEIQPDGYADGGISLSGFPAMTRTNRVDAIALITPATYAAFNFYEWRIGLSGLNYSDGNNNRRLDPGEPGPYASVSAVLRSTDAGGIYSTTAVGYYDGYYEFTDVPSGTYQITVGQSPDLLDNDDQPGTVDGAPSGAAGPLGSDIITGVVYVAGAAAQNYNFGDLQASTLHGNVYLDLNNDGYFQGYLGETGIEAVTLTLAGPDDNGATILLTTTTDVNGQYVFSALRPGVYTLTESQPDGYSDGIDRNGYPAGTVGQDAIGAIVIAYPGTYAGDYDFGERQNGLTGYVYNDATGDGIRQGFEQGIGGVQVTLSGTLAGGSLILSTTETNYGGFFSFSDLLTGTYELIEQQPIGWIDGDERAGTLGGAAGDDVIGAIPVNADSFGENYTFGEYQPSSLYGYVFLDLNDDGFFSNGELAIPGVTLTLQGLTDRGANAIFTETTVSYGYFAFGGLRPGVYTLTEIQPDGYTDGKDRWPNSALGTTDDQFVQTLPPGTSSGPYRFGESKAFLSGYVYHDANNDGFMGGGDAGLLNVSVYLTGTRDSDGSPVTALTRTNAFGLWQFVGLPAGVYTVSEAQPGGTFDGRETLGTGAGGAIAGNDLFTGLVVAGGGGLSYNFGELLPGGLTGYVYFDADNNGFFGAEPPIADAQVVLTGIAYDGQTTAMTTSTGGDGGYAFSGLKPGTYTLTETQPDGYLDGQDRIGSGAGGVAGNDVLAGLSLASNITGANYLFGERIGGLSGYVYRDANANSARENGEPGLNNIVVYLYGIDANGPLTRFAVTSNSGFYFFNDLYTGTYRLVEGALVGYIDKDETVGTLGGALGGIAPDYDEINSIAFDRGQYGESYNFGELIPSSLSGLVYYDINANQSYDGGDAPINGVTVVLSGTTDRAPSIVYTATTVGGGFAFAGLRPGVYSLIETQPDGYTDGPENIGTAGGVATGEDTISAIALQAGTGAQNYGFSERQTGLSGYVYLDTNNDGTRSGELGIQGVIVVLSGTESGGAPVLRQTESNGNGYYNFGNLASGAYRILEQQPAGYLDGRDTVGSLGGIAGQDVLSVTYTADQFGQNYNFGELLAASVFGTVYIDLNDNGAQNGGEMGIAGVTVTLQGADDLGIPVWQTRTTNSAGGFAFSGLRPGVYTLAEFQPAGYSDGKDSFPNGANNPISDLFGGLAPASGQDLGAYLFGESNAFLSGYVYEDADNDGFFDLGEAPISGVTILLSGTRSSDGSPVSYVGATAGAGLWQFVGIPAGIYTVTEIQPLGFLDGRETLGTGAGGAIAGNDVFTGLAVSGMGGLSYNFGELRAASLSGYVYFDVDNDGDASFGEPVIPGVLVVLSGKAWDGTPALVTATTLANGSYTFSGLAPGVYTLTEQQPAGWLDGLDRAGSAGGALVAPDTIAGIILGSGAAATDYRFGERISGLSGRVYRDLNDDGYIDPGETGVANAVVYLFGLTAGGPVTLSASANGVGFYYFGDLITGTYILSQTQPLGLFDGIERAGGLGGTVAGSAPDFDRIEGISLLAGQYGTEYNFGELPPSSLAGFVYYDANNNGSRDGVEVLIAAVTVILSGTDDLGRPVLITATTDATTGFTFSGLRPGQYAISEEQPEGYTDGPETIGNQGGQLGVNDRIANIGLLAARNGTGYAFAERQNGLTGYVYADNNNDGFRQPGLGEGGIGGVTVILTGTTAGGGVWVTTTTTAAGFFNFGNLDAGPYRLREIQPAGYLDGREQAGNLGGTAGNDFIDLTFSAAQYGTGYTFGELAPARLSGHVYNDLNDNGLYEYSLAFGEGGPHYSGEPALSGVIIILTGVDDLGASLRQTATTNGLTGDYAFSGLRPGAYTLTEQQPSGYADGKDTAGCCVGSVVSNDQFRFSALAAGADAQNFNFGERRSGIAGTVRAGPYSGIGGAVVRLYGVDASGTAITRATATDGLGGFVFGDLLTGTYRISETQPAGYLDGVESVGNLGGLVGGAAPDYDEIGSIPYIPGQFGDGYLFNEVAPARVTGYVFYDVNGSGDRDGGDLNLANVTVVLSGTTDRGQPALMTTTTGNDGAFAFETLRPGTYALIELQPDGYTDGDDLAGTLGGTPDGADSILNLTLSAASEAINYRFGERQNGLSGYVYADYDNNGLKGPGDGGIGSVVVILTGTTNGGQPVNRVAQTSGSGYYSFGGLASGSYRIREAQPAGYFDGIDSLGNLGGVLGPDQFDVAYTGGQFGQNYNFGELPAAAIQGRVFLDVNNDGANDPSEPGISGVTVMLTGTNDLGQAITQTRLTDGNGGFLVSGLRPGTYHLLETQPAGYQDGIDTPGPAGGTLAPPDGMRGIILTPGANAGGYRFGERISGVSGFVYADANGDGFRQPGESGLGNVSMLLTGVTTGSIAITRAAMTDGFGFYAFGDLVAGTYRVTELQPDYYLDGIDSAGTLGGTPGPLGQDTLDFVYPGSGLGQGYNFGELAPGSVAGYVFYDISDNGLFEWAGCNPEFDPYCVWDEESIETSTGAGARLTLRGMNDLGEAIYLTATTNANGRFEFGGLRRGTYTLTELQRDVDIDGQDSRYPPGGGHTPLATNDVYAGFFLDVGQGAGAVFGEKPSLSGYVYRDDNDNGLREPSLASLCNSPEFGVAAVSIQISGIDIYNNSVSRSASTFGVKPGAANRCNEGFYYFGGLVTGTYSVREFQPADYLDGQEHIGTAGGLTTTNDIISRIVYTPGTWHTGYDFGELRNIIAGWVFMDGNANGLYDGGEPGLIQPATIRLTGRNTLSQTVDLTQITYGRYAFSGLRPGVYTLTEEQPAGYQDGAEQLGVGGGGVIAGNDIFTGLVLAPGAIADGYTFGELISSTLTGRVLYRPFAPSSAASEGLAGIEISLSGRSVSGAAIATATVTDVGGGYAFGDLPPGTYTVTQVSLPTGYTDNGVALCQPTASAGLLSRSIGGIALGYGGSASACNFLYGPALTGLVFADNDGDGVLDPGEAGIGGARIDLFGTLTDGGLVTRSMTTGCGGLPCGRFAFGGLLTGTYRLVETQPGGYVDGPDFPGTLGGVTTTATYSNDVIGQIAYTPNGLGENYRFGERAYASLGGLVFLDTNADGHFSGDPERALYTPIILDGVNDLGESILITGASGFYGYGFGGLRPGAYTLTEIQPLGYTDWVDSVGNRGGFPGDDQTRFIPLGWGDGAAGYDFAERQLGLVGVVYADRDADGVYVPAPDGPDTGISGVTVWLSGTTLANESVALSATTLSNGGFQFPNLQAGTYALTEIQPAAYTDGADTAGTLGGTVSNDQIANIFLGDAGYGQGYAFGEIPPSSISGYVYVDANNDGFRGGGEPGIAGVSVTLSGLTTQGASVNWITRTNSSGAFTFRNVPFGLYALTEIQPDFLDGLDRAGQGAGGLALNDQIINLAVYQPLDAVNYLFGERSSGISGYVYVDESGDGARQVTETALSPVTLRLTGVAFNGAAVNQQTKTGLNGYYAFDALPGAYALQEVQPFGYLNGPTGIGTMGGALSGTNAVVGIVLSSGGAGTGYDFGEVAPRGADLAAAMGIDPFIVGSATLDVDGPNKAGVGGLSAPVIGAFPSEGATWAYLGTGNMVFADQPNSAPNTFGLGDYARLAITLTVPASQTCMSVDFAFYSEEFPEFVGSAFNDTFEAYLDGLPFARDANGNRISINSVFGALPGYAGGTTYDAATQRLRAQVEVTPGTTSVLSFTLNDVGDTAYDSAVFLDRVRFSRPGGRGCRPGADYPISIALSKTLSLDNLCGVTQAMTVAPNTEVYACYVVTNSGEYTLTRHSLSDSALGVVLADDVFELPPGASASVMASQFETRTNVGVATWTAVFSGTFMTSASAATTVTVPGPTPTPTPPPPGGATFILNPAITQTRLGVPITVALMITSVANLGGYEVALAFNPALVTVTRVTAGPFLASTGRTVLPFTTVLSSTVIRLGASSIGAGAGPNGSGVLAWLQLSPVGTGMATLDVREGIASNATAGAMTVTEVDGQLTIINPGAAYLPVVRR